MITASEPLEFIPRGRQAVEEHPGPQLNKHQLNNSCEHVLLSRMQKVNISSDENFMENWSVREIFKATNKNEGSFGKFFNQETKHSYLSDSYANSEEEIYFKKHTAVWTKGFQEGDSVLPTISFTCDTNIRFAFFCNSNFVRPHMKEGETSDMDITSICIIDCTSLRVYCSTGEDFVVNLDFPISSVHLTKSGLILEKDAANTVILNHSISMPRIFSLSHPMEEVRPVLNKSSSGLVTYLTDSDYRIVYSIPNKDIVLMYDNKVGKHFVSKFRKATDDEIYFVGCGNENNTSVINQSHRLGTASFAHNSMKVPSAKNSTAIFARSNISTTGHASHFSKYLNTSFHHSTGSPMVTSHRSSAATPLSRLQSTLGGSHFISVQNIRKIAQTPAPKPILPEYCLDFTWTEAVNGRDFCEVATTAFMHTDLAGQEYLCYLLPRSNQLQLVCMDGDKYTFGQNYNISAKDAVCLNQMKMIAVIDIYGSLVLYSGAMMVSKVHVTRNITAVSLERRPSLNSSFPRRSSLLPSVKQTEAPFDMELHLLSPVPPLQPQFSNRGIGLRDPAGNRLTLVYNGGKMYRISLPLISECPLVKRCIMAFRETLSKDHFIKLIVKWYGARNPPGSHNIDSTQEWEIFRNMLSDQMGRAILINESSTNISLDPEEPKKRRKNSDQSLGTNDDWSYLLSVWEASKMEYIKKDNLIKHNDSTAPLFTQIPLIFFVLHLLYEDLKLEMFFHSCLKQLAQFLYTLAYDMKLTNYYLHYIMDYPQLLDIESTNFFTAVDGNTMEYSQLLTGPVPNLYAHVNSIIQAKECSKYPCINNANTQSRNILQIITLICQGHLKIKNWIEDLEFPGTSTFNSRKKRNRIIKGGVPRSEQLIQMLINMDITRSDIKRLPTAINLIIAQCLECSRLSPPIGSSPEAYTLIQRSELAKLVRCEDELDNFTVKITNSGMDVDDPLFNRYPQTQNVNKNEVSNVEDDGMDNTDTNLLGLRFPDDLRISEVRRILNSSQAVPIDIKQSPGVSDHEFIEEQEKQLYALCTRTMTLPIGRGMFTFRSAVPIPTEYMPIPRLCLTGKEPVKGASIEMTQIEFPANMNVWPLFHNGVAAGLRISPGAKDIDSTWIVYNKPKGQADGVPEHAGFLMALGLNGHLKKLSFMSMYEYLVKVDEMTSGGILLGIAATHRGTMDNIATKLLSVHIEALLPATALELDIPHNIQVASLMGIGLVYQGTANRHIAEILLQEIGRPPGPEMENSVERESFALSAGLALGLVTLGQGESPAGLRDLQLPDILHYYMVGGNKRPLFGSQKEKYKLPSFQVREGDMVNIDVTAPGATLALGLMFLKTGNSAIADWMMPPDTNYLLDLVRPDLLLLRVIAKGLIMWDDIKPSQEWLFDQFPSSLKFDTHTGPRRCSTNFDDEAISQAYCNIIAGAAFCIALKFAGTENRRAYFAIRKALKLFLSANNQYIGEFAGKVTVETCLILTLISISLVFAGSGDLEIFRIIRYLRSRIGPNYSQVTYGSQMGIHMALGFLFLGSGRYTISRTPEAIAALVCSLFPKFPNHSNDNRYHLQSFRHLYVLATEPRLFLPRDIDTKRLCLCKIQCVDLSGTEVDSVAMAPCMLPDLSTLKKVIVHDENYWPVSFEKERNWDQLIKVLENSSCIDIKRRAGCLSHIDDPDRLKSILAQTLTAEQYSCWKIEAKTLLSFSTDSRVVSFLQKILYMNNMSQSEIGQNEKEKSQLLTIFFYNCLRKDQMHAIPIYLSILDILENSEKRLSSNEIWQIKLIESYSRSSASTNNLITKELVNSAIVKFKAYIKELMKRHANELKIYITSLEIDYFKLLDRKIIKHVLACVIYYELFPNVINVVNLTGTVNYIRLLYEFKKLGLSLNTINCMKELLQTL